MLQATLREPVKWNMYKAVALCYSVISVSYIIVTVAGYWVSQLGSPAGEAVLLPPTAVPGKVSMFGSMRNVQGC